MCTKSRYSKCISIAILISFLLQQAVLANPQIDCDTLANRSAFQDEKFLELLSAARNEADEGEPGPGNIAHGEIPREYEEQLHAQFADQFDSENNVTAEYDDQIPAYKQQLKQIIGSVEIEADLRADLITLLDDSRLQLFFFKPRYGLERFKFVIETDTGREVVFEAEAHFGYGGAERGHAQRNVYLASPSFASHPPAEKLAVIVHELVHLLKGKTDAAHQQGIDLGRAIIKKYDEENYDLAAAEEKVKEYLNLKEDLFQAVDEGGQEQALAVYDQWARVIEEINDLGDISPGSLGGIIFDTIQDQVGPALAGILGEITKVRGDVNARGIIVDLITQRCGIRATLAWLVFDTINQMPLEEEPRIEDVFERLLHMSISLGRELKRLGEREFPAFFNDLRDSVVDEVVTALYDDHAPREHWRNEILKSINTYHISNVLPREMLTVAHFDKKSKEIVLSSLRFLNRTVAQAFGAYDPQLGKLFFNVNYNTAEARSTIKHELVHYLAERGEIRINREWEHTTNAITLADIVLHAGVEDLGIFQHKFGPCVKELYQRGKTIVQQGKSAVHIAPQMVEGAAYFSIDLLVMEAIDVHEESGLPTDALRRYLNYSKRKPVKPFEIEQAQRDTYEAQRVAGLIMGGIMVAEKQKTGKDPLRTMKDYFYQLDQLFGPPSKEDAAWVEKTLKKELESLASVLFGASVLDFEPAEVTDQMGLWKYEKQDEFIATVRHWPMHPTHKDDPDREKYRQLAAKQAEGNLLLAYYRSTYGGEELGEDQEKEEYFSLSPFQTLWEFLVIPSAVYKGTTDMDETITRQNAGEHVEAPDFIKVVFERIFNLGNPEVEQQWFDSYPLHLQFINTLLRRWSQFDKKNPSLEDPRVAEGSEIDLAVLATKEAWKKVLFELRENSDLENIYTIIKDEIWPVYKELFDKDLETEKYRDLLKRLENEEQADVQPGEFDPDDLTQEQRDILEAIFNALPPEVQQQIIEQAMQAMSQCSMGGQGQQGQEGQEGQEGQQGQQGQPSPGQSGGEGVSGESLEDLEGKLEQLGQSLQQINDLLADISDGMEGVGQDAKNVSQGSRQAAGDKDKDKAEEIVDKTQSIVNQAQEALESGQKISSTAQSANDDAFDTAENNLSSPTDGQGVCEGTSELSQQTQEQEEKIQELLDKARELKAKAQQLLAAVGRQDSVGTQAAKDDIQQGSRQIRDQAGEIKDQAGDCRDLAGELSAELKELKNLQDKIKQALGEKAEGIGDELREAGGEQGEGEGEGEGKGEGEAEGDGESSGEGGEADGDAADASPSTSRPDGPGTGTSDRFGVPQAPTSLDNILDRDKPETTPQPVTTSKVQRNYDIDLPSAEQLAEAEFEDEMLQTGLERHELIEYQEWRSVLTDGETDHIEDLVEWMRVLLNPEQKIKWKGTSDPDHEIRDVVSVYMGDDEGAFEKLVKTEPMPVRLTLVFDKSGSMGWKKRHEWARLTMMLLLEAVYEINSMYHGRNQPLIEFELIIYDGETRVLLDHEGSKMFDGETKEQLIYRTLKRLEPGGGTDDVQAMVNASERVEKTIRQEAGKLLNILMSVGDGNFGDIGMQQVVKDNIEERGIETFIASTGDAEARRDVKKSLGEEHQDRVILPKKLEDLPKMIGEKVVKVFKKYSNDPRFRQQGFFGEPEEELHQELREVFKDQQKFHFVQDWETAGKSDEGETGSLLETLPAAKSSKYKELVLEAMTKLAAQEEYVNLKQYSPVIVDIDKSGHFSAGRQRIYIPLVILEIAAKNLQWQKALLETFILHEYLHSIKKRMEKRLDITEEEKALTEQIDLSSHDSITAYLKERERGLGQLDDQGRSTAEVAYEQYLERDRKTAYRNFYLQTREGREYLIYKKYDNDGNETSRREWERGAGGRFVPDTITVDDDANESLILELLDRMYDKGEQFTSCSADGQLYIREGANGELHLVKRTASGFWEEEPSEKDIFRPRAKRLHYQQKGKYKQFEGKDTRITYRLDEKGCLEILREEDNWLAVDAQEQFSEYVQVRYLSDIKRYAVYDNERKLILVEAETGIVETLAITEHKEQSLVLMKGETGLGKDEIVRAAAKLMNEEVFYITCHEEMTRTGLIARRVLINGESRPLYSPLTYVQHNGGWCVLSEFNYMAPEAKGTLKKSLSDNTHSWYYSNKGGRRQRNDHVHNHPRGRYLATTNTGIIEREDWAISDRQEEMHFVWRYPPDEVNLQVELAKRSLTKAIARGQRKPLTQAEYDAEIERITEKAKKMVSIATQLRFVYMGFADTQRNELLRLSKVKGKEAQVQARKDWYEKLRSDSFCKIKGRPGDKLKRAPSPRVLANILQYALNYPNSWRHSPWAVIEMYFNFEVNQLSYRDKEIHMEKVRKRFQAADQAGMFKDSAKVEPVILDAKEGHSFRYEGDTLMVVPYNREGKENKYWDKIRIRIPKGMRRQVNKAIERWLSTGNEENSRVLYHLLQFRALGKSPILIGEQGTGKTELAEATQVLLSGLELAKQVDSETKFSELTWKMELEAGGNSYPEEGVVLQGAQAWEGEGATVLLDEIAAGAKNVVGGLNEIVERGYVVMPDGSVYYAGDLFGFIFTANPPGGPFEVEAPHDAFIERCPVIVMKPLPIEQMYDFLLKEKGHLGESVNWNVIGHLPKAADNKPITKDSEGNEYPEGRWQGLVGVVQYLRGAVDRQRNKRVIPRIPGFRTFKRMFRKMINTWDNPNVFPGMNEQEKLWYWFNSCFVQEGTAKEKAAWEELLKKAFKESQLWTDDEGKDAVAEYLNGEDMIIRVDEPEWYREPDSEDPEIDQILQYIQKVTRGKGLKDRLNGLVEKVEELIGGEKDWQKLKFGKKLERVYKLREIYQIVKLAREERKLGVKAGNYLDDEYNLMEAAILKPIRIKLVTKEGWPPSFFQQRNSWLELKELWGELPATGDLTIDDLLGKLAVNIDDRKYRNEKIDTLIEMVAAIAKKLAGQELFELIGDLSLIMRIKENTAKIQKAGKPVKKLKDFISRAINAGPLPLTELNRLKKMKEKQATELFGVVGVKHETTAKTIAEIQRLAEGCAEDDFARKKIGEIGDQIQLLARLYRWVTVKAVYEKKPKKLKELIAVLKMIQQIQETVIEQMTGGESQAVDAIIGDQLARLVSAVEDTRERLAKRTVTPVLLQKGPPTWPFNQVQDDIIYEGLADLPQEVMNPFQEEINSVRDADLEGYSRLTKCFILGSRYLLQTKQGEEGNPKLLKKIMTILDSGDQEDPDEYIVSSLISSYLISVLTQAKKEEQAEGILGETNNIKFLAYHAMLSVRNFSKSEIEIVEKRIADMSIALSYLVSVLSRIDNLPDLLTDSALRGSGKDLVEQAYDWCWTEARPYYQSKAASYLISVLAEAGLWEKYKDKLPDLVQIAVDSAYQIMAPFDKILAFSELIIALTKAGWTKEEILALKPQQPTAEDTDKNILRLAWQEVIETSDDHYEDSIAFSQLFLAAELAGFTKTDFNNSLKKKRWKGWDTSQLTYYAYNSYESIDNDYGRCLALCQILSVLKRADKLAEFGKLLRRARSAKRLLQTAYAAANKIKDKNGNPDYRKQVQAYCHLLAVMVQAGQFQEDDSPIFNIRNLLQKIITVMALCDPEDRVQVQEKFYRLLGRIIYHWQGLEQAQSQTETTTDFEQLPLDQQADQITALLQSKQPPAQSPPQPMSHPGEVERLGVLFGGTELLLPSGGEYLNVPAEIISDINTCLPEIGKEMSTMDQHVRAQTYLLGYLSALKQSDNPDNVRLHGEAWNRISKQRDYAYQLIDYAYYTKIEFQKHGRIKSPVTIKERFKHYLEKGLSENKDWESFAYSYVIATLAEIGMPEVIEELNRDGKNIIQLAYDSADKIENPLRRSRAYSYLVRALAAAGEDKLAWLDKEEFKAEVDGEKLDIFQLAYRTVFYTETISMDRVLAISDLMIALVAADRPQMVDELLFPGGIKRSLTGVAMANIDEAAMTPVEACLANCYLIAALHKIGAFKDNPVMRDELCQQALSSARQVGVLPYTRCLVFSHLLAAFAEVYGERELPAKLGNYQKIAKEAIKAALHKDNSNEQMARGLIALFRALIQANRLDLMLNQKLAGRDVDLLRITWEKVNTANTEDRPQLLADLIAVLSNCLFYWQSEPAAGETGDDIHVTAEAETAINGLLTDLVKSINSAAKQIQPPRKKKKADKSKAGDGSRKRKFDLARIAKVKGRITALAVSPDGKKITIAYTYKQRGRIECFDAGTGEEIEGLRFIALREVEHEYAHDWDINGLSYSPDGRQLISVAEDGVVRAWDAATGELMPDLEFVDPNLLKSRGEYYSHDGKIMAVCHSPDSSRIATVGNDDLVKIWDAATGQLIVAMDFSEFKGDPKYPSIVKTVCFSSTGKRLIVGTRDATIMAWNAATGELIKGSGFIDPELEKSHPHCAHADRVTALIGSPDSRTIISSGFDGRIKAWNAVTGELLPQLAFSDPSLTGKNTGLAHKRPVRSVCYSTDGSMILSAGSHGRIKAWDAQTGELLPDADFVDTSLKGRNAGKSHTKGINGIAFVPDSNCVVSCADEGKLKIWQAAEPAEETASGLLKEVVLWVLSQRLQELPAITIPVVTIKDPISEKISAVTNGKLPLPKRGFTKRHGNDEKYALATSSDGQYTITGGNGNRVRIFNNKTGKMVADPSVGSRIYSLQFSPDNKILAIGTEDKKLRLFELADEQGYAPEERFESILEAEPAVEIEDLAGKVNSIAFSNDGQLLAFTADKRMYVIQLDEELAETVTDEDQFLLNRLYDGQVSGLAFSPGDEYLALGRESGAKPRKRSFWLYPIKDQKGDYRIAEFSNIFRSKKYLSTLPSLSPLKAIKFSSDGQWLAVLAEEKLWLYPIGNQLSTNLAERLSAKDTICLCGKNLSIDFTADSRYLLVGGKNIRAYGLRDSEDRPKTGEDYKKLFESRPQAQTKDLRSAKIAGISCSADGSTLSAITGNAVYIWHEEPKLKSPATFIEYKQQALISEKTCSLAAISPNGKLVAVTGWDSQIKICDAETGEEIVVLTDPKHDWQLTGGSPSQKSRAHKDGIKSLTFSPDNTKLVSSGKSTVKVWDINTGELNELIDHLMEPSFGAHSLHPLTSEASDQVLIRISADGKKIISAGTIDMKIRGWDPDTGQLISIGGVYDKGLGRLYGDYRAHSDRITCLEIIDEETIVSAADDGTIKLWKLKGHKGKPQKFKHPAVKGGKRFQAHAGAVKEIAVSRNGQILVSYGGDRFHIWDVRSRERIASYRCRKRCPFAVSPEGDVLVVGLVSGTIRLVDTKTGKCLPVKFQEEGRAKAHRAKIIKISFTADGKHLISSDATGHIRLWDRFTGKLMQTITETPDLGDSTSQNIFRGYMFSLSTASASLVSWGDNHLLDDATVWRAGESVEPVIVEKEPEVWQTEEEPEEDLLTMIIRVYLDYLNVPADTIPELIKRIRKKLSQQPAGKQDIAVPQNLRAALWRLLTVYHSEHVEEALNTIDTQPLKIKQQPWYRELLEKIKEVQTDTEVKSKIAKIIKSLPPEESGAQNLASAV